MPYSTGVIKSFKSKALAELWSTGRTKGIEPEKRARVLRRLDALNNAKALTDMDLPGFKLHALKGHSPTRYSVWVNGPWRVTFEFDNGDAYRVDLEQYH
jgi:proteic killer suppression protein